MNDQTQVTGSAAAPYARDVNDPLPAAIRTLWRVLVERFWVFVCVALVLFSGATMYVLNMTPLYSASALLKVDPTASPTAGMDNSTSKVSPDRAQIQSEVDIIRSHGLAKEVAKELNLFNDSEFDPMVGTPVNAPGQAERLDAIAGGLIGSLSVYLNDNSYVLNVDMMSADPAKAARIANAFAAAYVRNNVGTRTGTAAQESEWLGQRSTELARQVQTADAEVARYKAQAGIVEGGANGTITDQQIGPLAAQLASAESDAAEARAKVTAARAQISSGNLDAVGNVLGSQVVTALRAQRAEVLRNRDDITARYGPLHPESVKVGQQLKSLDEQILQEAQRQITSQESAARASEARAASLRGALSKLRADQARNTRAAVTADTLEREADAKRTAFEQLAKAQQESLQASRNSLPNVRVIEQARPAEKPVSPNKPLLLGAAFLLSLIAGGAVITVQELLSPGVRTLKDVEVRLGIPMLASVPKIPAIVQKEQSPADYLLSKPMTFYAEAFRTLRSALMLKGQQKLPKVITIASSVPGEGKSSTALSLARVMAMAGDRVILVDCDFRRSGVHLQTGYQSDVTLLDILRDGADPEAAIKPDRVAGVDLLANNGPVFTPEDMLNGKAMHDLLTILRQRYDAVLLDSPPLLGIADARAASSQADAVVVVIRWDDTPVDAVDKALTILQQDQAQVAGAVLNVVDPSADILGSNYYSNRYASYYQT
ncbi:MAG: GumC family protein [Sphingobium sp.]